jgi:predicted small lipoprotein YifL
MRTFGYRLAPLMAMILVGCGQKGPLSLPKPQFPAPAAANAADPASSSPAANVSTQPPKQ